MKPEKQKPRDRAWMRRLVRLQVIVWPRWWVRPTFWRPTKVDAMRLVYEWCFHFGPLEIRRFVKANVKGHSLDTESAATKGEYGNES